jgi:hypothetical protein
MSVRIAMISGPRTVSTAMMRSWGARADTALWDEPFYAHYLYQSGKAHPGRDVVMKEHAHEIDADEVVRRLHGPVPDGKAIWYQKHIAQHLLDDVDLSWVTSVRCAFLVRDPSRMLASLWKRYPQAGLDDTGLAQQVRVFERVLAQAGEPPPVIDSDDVRRDPRGMLQVLCARLNVPFDEAMLQWATGPRATDGAWGPYWYDVVWQSTCFEPPPAGVPSQFDDPRQLEVLKQCTALYDQLSPYRIGTGN